MTGIIGFSCKEERVSHASQHDFGYWLVYGEECMQIIKSCCLYSLINFSFPGGNLNVSPHVNYEDSSPLGTVELLMLDLI